MTELRASDTVAAKIRSLREFAGWSRREMAEHCGLSESVIENIESGRPGEDGSRRRDVTVDELLTIARALDVSLLTFLPEEASQPSEADRAAARVRRREREMMMGEMLVKIGECEGALQRLEQQRNTIVNDISDLRQRIAAYRKTIARLRGERD